MEKDLKFNSAVCTSRIQSERLLALGLKKETADMVLTEFNDGSWRPTMTWIEEPNDYDASLYPEFETIDIPAWSLGRLLALGNGEDWNAEITLKDEKYGIHTGFDTTWYDDIFEAVIAWIEEDIKEGYFNKEYLV